jgi:hypothetical protein
MPDLYQGMRVSKDDAMPSHPTLAIVSNQTATTLSGQRRHLPFVAHTAVSGALPLLARSSSRPGVTHLGVKE